MKNIPRDAHRQGCYTSPPRKVWFHIVNCCTMVTVLLCCPDLPNINFVGLRNETEGVHYENVEEEGISFHSSTRHTLSSRHMAEIIPATPRMATTPKIRGWYRVETK